MEPKTKEQLRAFLAEAMENAPPVLPARAIRHVSIEEYVKALRNLDAVITEKQRTMLLGHAIAPGQALTMTELAALVGFPSYSAANLQYGLLAGKLADMLGIPRPKYLVYVIASFDDDPASGESRAHMYPELRAALQQLGWLPQDHVSQTVPASSQSPSVDDNQAVSTAVNSRLSIQDVITVLEHGGFTRPEQSGLKVVRMEHPALSSPLFVKQSSSMHARLQAPLVLHPNHENKLQDWLAIAGVERGDARYYHNSNLRGFPKRRNSGATDIAYGVDLGFRHAAALEQLLASLLGTEPVTKAAQGGLAGFTLPEGFDPQDMAVTDTERDALIKARIGQGDYRQALLAYWGGCAVTDCTVPALLRASHIKPWREASGSERLDPYNGLLLTPNLDLAFDQGLITFDDQGLIHLSPELDPDSATALHLYPHLRLRQIEPRHCSYLAWHREHLFRK